MREVPNFKIYRMLQKVGCSCLKDKRKILIYNSKVNNNNTEHESCIGFLVTQLNETLFLTAIVRTIAYNFIKN